MKTFITYLNYDNSEFYLWDVCTRKQESIEKYFKVHLPDFFTGLQPDISNLNLVVTDIDRVEYDQLIDSSTPEEIIESILCKIDNDPTTDYLVTIDGNINFDLGRFFGINFKNCNPSTVDDEVDELFYELDELRNTDPNQYDKIVRSFILMTFGYC